jgi:hypothetical protein
MYPQLPKPTAQNATQKLVETGFLPIVSKITASKDKNIVDVACVMCFSLIAKLEPAAREPLVAKVSKALLNESSSLEPLQSLTLQTSLFNLLGLKSHARFPMFMTLIEKAVEAKVPHWIVSPSVLKSTDSFARDWGLSNEVCATFQASAACASVDFFL